MMQFRGVLALLVAGVWIACSAQAQQQALQSDSKSRTERFERSFELYKEVFSGARNSASPGINYRHFNAQMLRNLNTPDRDEAIKLPLVAFFIGRIDLIDQIKPENMTRGEYLGALLREARKGGYLEKEILNNPGLLNSLEANRKIQVTRPIDAEIGKERTATVAIIDVAFRDIAMQLLLLPDAKRVILERDIARHIGVISEMDVSDDMTGFMLGYAAATNPEFTANGKLPITIGFNKVGPTEAQHKLKPAYCSAVETVTAPGRHPNLTQNNAVSAGFILGKEHYYQNYAINNNISFQGVDCPVAPLQWNKSMSELLTGVERGRREIESTSDKR